MRHGDIKLSDEDQIWVSTETALIANGRICFGTLVEIFECRTRLGLLRGSANLKQRRMTLANLRWKSDEGISMSSIRSKAFQILNKLEFGYLRGG
jgi:hypothetical protein